MDLVRGILGIILYIGNPTWGGHTRQTAHRHRVRTQCLPTIQNLCPTTSCTHLMSQTIPTMVSYSDISLNGNLRRGGAEGRSNGSQHCL
ncbi:hypothetical protein C8R44DRAFT_815367 [Mycena epipterygia]|nr:hypothetical protein C8R44DRAFT_815367 [Mycena epipterygia]